jgi:hypothetical protein
MGGDDIFQEPDSALHRLFPGRKRHEAFPGGETHLSQPVSVPRQRAEVLSKAVDVVRL